MYRDHITLDAIDCDSLIFSTGRFECVICKGETDIDKCMSCKFTRLRCGEDRIREERRNG